MRSAPSVIYSVGRCHFYGGLLLGLAAAGATVLLLGASQMNPTAARTQLVLVGAVMWFLWLVFASWSWRRGTEGRLHWDALSGGAEPGLSAGAWRWHSDAFQDGTPLRRVEPMLDLQTRMLLRLRNADAATRWVWVEQVRDPARWDDLRRALHALK